MKNMSRRLIWIPCLVLLFGAGIACGWIIRGGTSRADVTYDNPPLRARDTQYQFISPLFACGALGRESFEEFRPLQSKVQKLIDRSIQNGSAKMISVYFRDLDRGRRLSINENERYFPASLQKVPLMIAYFKLAESNPTLLSEKIVYDGSFDANQKEDIKSAASITKGSYAIDDLIAAMILHSDNNATRLLFNNLNKKIMAEVYSDLNVSPPEAGGELETMTAKSYAYFFRILYNATYLTRDISEKALRLLSEADFAEGIRAGVSEKLIPIAEKFGESEIYSDEKTLYARELHDCGIVYYPQSNYLLCVMTKGSDFSKLKGTIRDISRATFEEVNSLGYKRTGP